MKKYILAITLVLAGCALPPSKESLRIQETTYDYIASRGDCIYLDTKTRRSGWGGIAANIGIDNAKIALKGDAGRMGGTHVVWIGQSIGGLPSVTARIYKCGKTHAAPIFEE